MARRFRPRKEFKFWLYHDLAEDMRLMEYIEYLRKTRQFAKTIRNGLRLMWTLGEGDTSILFELFPGLKATLQVLAPTAPPPDDDRFKREIDGLKQLILEQGRGIPVNAPMVALPAVMSSGSQQLGGFKLLGAPAPVDDDDYELLTSNMKKAAPGVDGGANFLKGLTGFVDSRKHGKQGEG